MPKSAGKPLVDFMAVAICISTPLSSYEMMTSVTDVTGIQIMLYQAKKCAVS